MDNLTPNNTNVEYLYHWVLGVAFQGEQEHSDEVLLAALKTIHDEDSSILPVLVEHLQKGSATAHYAVMDVFNPLVEQIVDWIKNPDDYVNGPVGDSYSSLIRLAWIVGNVMDDAGIPRDELSSIAYTAVMLGYGDPDDLTAEEWFLRGRAALSATELWVHEGDVEDKKDFIEYAGKHWDIGAVIRTAKERSTTDVNVLTAIVDHSGVHVPLQRGAL